ncbi:MAG: carboxymuconolactone decarboxylase family protein [Halanaerobiales bacterium]|nr:carboxymuconolactone decarboxylase family protein [Halanaerobiales bacterium]
MSSNTNQEKNIREENIREKLGEDVQNLLADYHHLIWRDDVIPLKYKYLIALASAIFDDHEVRTILELKKAVANGATRVEVLEVLRQIVWLKGAPTLVKLAPVIKYLDKHLPEKV